MSHFVIKKLLERDVQEAFSFFLTDASSNDFRLFRIFSRTFR